MKNKITEIVLILDASGSMRGLKEETISGVNALLEEQKKLENGDTVYVTTIIFNSVSHTVYQRKNLRDVQAITAEEYKTEGFTALYDAVGGAIDWLDGAHKDEKTENVPEKTMIVIVTDGLENASRHYGARQVWERIAKKQEQGWEFIFLAANINAAEHAEAIGISRERAVDWSPDGEGVHVLYEGVAECMYRVRSREEYSRAAFQATDDYFQEKRK